MAMNRRDALKTIGGLAGMAGLSKFLPACSSDDGPVGITTYVYLMLENRTYDHVLGARSWKEGKPGDGLRDGITQLDAEARFLRMRAKWLSQRDCAELFRCALEADVRWAVAFGTSNTPRQLWSLAEARRLLGYEPKDAAPVERENCRGGL